jgi:A/G-specific adenine glycosylase
VKRVLARVYQVDGWSGMNATMKQLWQLAEQQTPARQSAVYNQAMMDLGSMVCKRRNPVCEECPLQSACLSYRHNSQARFPVPKPKKARVQKHRWLLLHRDSDRLLLERRPQQGIWGGLWSLPEIEQLGALTDWQTARVGEIATATQLSENLLRHQFSHFELAISLAEIRVSDSFVNASHLRVNENSDLAWIAWNELSKYGMPAPVEKLLNQLS